MMKAIPFVDVAVDTVSKDIPVKGADRFIVLFEKSGVGTCTLTARWKVSGGAYHVVPHPTESAGQVHALTSGTVVGQFSVENPGVDYLQLEVSSVSDAVSVDAIVGMKPDAS